MRGHGLPRERDSIDLIFDALAFELLRLIAPSMAGRAAETIDARP